MRIVIAEDEIPAAEKLSGMIAKFSPGWEIVAVLRSVEDAVKWFRTNPAPDLAFFDISLSDGLSLEIFAQCELNCPVIFVTAYDQYLTDALTKHGIDYLLKPLRQQQLDDSLRKFLRLKEHFTASYRKFYQEYSSHEQNAPQRFLVKKGKDLVSVKTEDIAYFFTENKLVFLFDHNGQRYLADHSLGELETMLAGAGRNFFRVNRQFLVNAQAVKKLKPQARSRIILELEPPAPEEVLVASETSAALKDWLNS